MVGSESLGEEVPEAGIGSQGEGEEVPGAGSGSREEGEVGMGMKAVLLG